jgi:cytochrome c
MRTAAIAAVGLAAIVGAAQWALAQGKPPDTGDGQLAFNNACRTCHTLREGDNRLGPNLHKVVGRKAGAVPGYAYSSAMKDADLVWDKATLDRFIAKPDEVIPGHNMKPYGGITSTEERAKIVAYLEASGVGN